MDFQPPKKMKLPRGSGAQAPSPAFGRGFCKVVSRESFARSRGRLRSLVPKGLAGDFRQSEVEGTPSRSAGSPLPALNLY